MINTPPKEAPIATQGSKGVFRPKAIDPSNAEKSLIPQRESITKSQNQSEAMKESWARCKAEGNAKKVA